MKKICISLFFIVILALPSVTAIRVASQSSDDVELEVRGGFAFNMKVVNHKDKPVNCSFFVEMWNFVGMYDAMTFKFSVPPKTVLSSWVDSYPMPFFFINATLTAYGEKTVKRTGIALSGFNIFLTKEINDECDTRMVMKQ